MQLQQKRVVEQLQQDVQLETITAHSLDGYATVRPAIIAEFETSTTQKHSQCACKRASVPKTG